MTNERIYQALNEFEHMLKVPTERIKMSEFMKHTSDFNGSWVETVLPGIKHCFPELYASLPEGTFSDNAISALLFKVLE